MKLRFRVLDFAIANSSFCGRATAPPHPWKCPWGGFAPPRPPSRLPGGGFAPPDPPHGISWGGLRPPRPPHDNKSKNLPSWQIFWNDLKKEDFEKYFSTNVFSENVFRKIFRKIFFEQIFFKNYFSKKNFLDVFSVRCLFGPTIGFLWTGLDASRCVQMYSETLRDLWTLSQVSLLSFFENTLTFSEV